MARNTKPTSGATVFTSKTTKGKYSTLISGIMPILLLTPLQKVLQNLKTIHSMLISVVFLLF